MDIFKEIQKEESNKGSLVHNWHCQELEHFITELIKKDRAEQLLIHSVVVPKGTLVCTSCDGTGGKVIYDTYLKCKNCNGSGAN